MKQHWRLGSSGNQDEEVKKKMERLITRQITTGKGGPVLENVPLDELQGDMNWN